MTEAPSVSGSKGDVRVQQIAEEAHHRDDAEGADEQTGGDPRGALSQHQDGEGGGPRAERQPDAEFELARRGHAGKQRVDTHRRQQQGETAERHHEQYGQAPAGQTVAQHLVESSHLLQWKPTVHRRQLTLDGARKRQRVTVGAQRERDQPRRNLAGRSIHHRFGVDTRAIVSDVANDANDLQERRRAIGAETDSRSDGGAGGPEASREAFADDDRRRRVGTFPRVEGASVADRNLKRTEVAVRHRRGEHERLRGIGLGAFERDARALPHDGRDRCGGGDGLHAGQRAQPRFELLAEEKSRRRGGEAPRRQLH
jgi:hypothetical protein